MCLLKTEEWTIFLMEQQIDRIYGLLATLQEGMRVVCRAGLRALSVEFNELGRYRGDKSGKHYSADATTENGKRSRSTLLFFVIDRS